MRRFAVPGFMALVLLMAPPSRAADLKDFPTLDKLGSVEKFEAAYAKHAQTCVDEGGGGAGAAPCFSGHELWDREMNLAYKKLLTKLNKRQQELLRASQRAWIASRDSAFELNGSLLDRIYDEPGTMWIGPRADDADASAVMLVKARALLLRHWYGLATRSPTSSPSP